MARRLPVGAKIGKAWGWTKAIFQSETCEVQHLAVRKGWRCSEHHHLGKHNLFYVLSGRLRVTTTKDGLADGTVLGPGEMTSVRAGDRHSFEALSPCRLIELYWVGLDPDDIVRHSQGGQADPRREKK